MRVVTIAIAAVVGTTSLEGCKPQGKGEASAEGNQGPALSEHAQPPAAKDPAPSEIWLMSPDGVAASRKAGLRGDPESAINLALHYQAAGDPIGQRSREWWDIAVENGSGQAMLSQAIYLGYKDSAEHRVRAQFLLRIAQAARVDTVSPAEASRWQEALGAHLTERPDDPRFSALSGNGELALRLARRATADDHIDWWHVAVQNGHGQAMLIYAALLSSDGTDEGCTRARFWVKEAETAPEAKPSHTDLENVSAQVQAACLSEERE